MTQDDTFLDYDDLQPGVDPNERKTGIRRILQITSGVILIVAGIAMIFVPGPGMLAIMVGLNQIVPDNFMVRWLRKKIPGIPEDGKVPTRYVVVGVVFVTITTTIGIVWGDDIISWLRDLVGW